MNKASELAKILRLPSVRDGGWSATDDRGVARDFVDQLKKMGFKKTSGDSDSERWGHSDGSYASINWYNDDAMLFAPKIEEKFMTFKQFLKERWATQGTIEQEVLSAIAKKPSTPGELASNIGCSIQAIQNILDKLEGDTVASRNGVYEILK
jgi:hypothetical protein